MKNINHCRICAKNVGWIGVVSNLILVLLKYLVGITGHSKACLADALHSSSNIITAFAIFISRKYSEKPVSKEFPYGYGKIEYIMVTSVSLLIILGALYLGFVSLIHLMNNNGEQPSWTAVIVAVISIISNEMMFRYFYCVGTRLNSQTIVANAWANRADCFSSLGVIIGVIGSRFGINHLDPIAALVVVFIIIKICIDFVIESIYGLMDVSIENVSVNRIKKYISNLEEIIDIDYLHARQHGQKYWIVMSLKINPEDKIADCQNIKNQIVKYIKAQIENVDQVLIDFIT